MSIMGVVDRLQEGRKVLSEIWGKYDCTLRELMAAKEQVPQAEFLQALGVILNIGRALFEGLHQTGSFMWMLFDCLLAADSTLNQLLQVLSQGQILMDNEQAFSPVDKCWLAKSLLKFI